MDLGGEQMAGSGWSLQETCRPSGGLQFGMLTVWLQKQQSLEVVSDIAVESWKDIHAVVETYCINCTCLIMFALYTMSVVQAMLYKRFGGSKTPPGKPKFMALNSVCFPPCFIYWKCFSRLGFSRRTQLFHTLSIPLLRHKLGCTSLQLF